MSPVRRRIRSAIHTRWAFAPIRFTARAYRYIALRGLRGGLGCVAAELAGRNGEVDIDDKTVGRMRLRLGTSDVSVAAKILLEREYDLPLREQPAVIVDAGAYTGISARWFAARYPEARVIAVEPDPANFQLLERNVRDLPRVSAFHEAIWIADEPVYTRTDARAAWATQIGGAGADDELVPGVTMPTIIRRHAPHGIDLLKLDIEGTELDLFSAGVEDWLPAVRAIAVEVHDELRPGSRAAVLRACSDYRVTDIGHETLLLERMT